MSGNHNKNPELILNHTWEIGLSQMPNGTTPDLFLNEYFQPGDRFKIISNKKFQNQNDLLFIILDEADKFIYVLDAELIRKTQAPNSTPVIHEEVVVKFNDTVGPVSKDRVITLKAVRFKGKYNSLSQECIDRLEDVGSFIPAEEREKYCTAATKNLVTWKILEWDDWENPSASNEAPNSDGPEQPIEPFGKPEPGQGTASSTQ